MPKFLTRAPLALAVTLATASGAVMAQMTPGYSAYEVPDYQQGEAWLQQRLQQTDPGKKARNLIFFLGDGMNIATLTASRIYQGQLMGRTGEENSLSFERFPASALVKTYNTNQQTPDSAGTITALMTGVKTEAGVLSIGPEQERGTCAGAKAHEVATLLENASAAGYATGVVSTARITHATPAATYAHSIERDWESDADLSEEARQNGCQDIARQLIDRGFAGGLDVAMGGGLGNFLLASANGRRQDEDLTARFRQQYPQGQLLLSRNDLMAMSPATPILGLFSTSHMDYEADRRKADEPAQPSLEEMTLTAIRVLQEQTRSSDQGYVLVIESGRIDHAHHAGNAYRALDETVQLSDAVATADQLTNDDDTLIIVTADHSHTFSMAGYQQRGAPILGYANGNEDKQEDTAYTTLGYANGPGATAHNHDKEPEDPDYLQAALAPMSDETHGSDDVAAHAKGPGSQWFHGQLEQNSLYHLMVQSLQLSGSESESRSANAEQSE
ncbi:alkaline phosphatase [Parathalassolituus penaei]|uniref:Alkaline phosphatase n=1 Tax=Parathalassolituus penaei TaxID=2997323 RepID=A0A9X3EBQ6_9GAMM|nr:alkaline phosphatase [Parathalassolituus penaei]MCY0964260.1 alkaline phosphatase [Parathalassolituus penaei]